MPEHLIIKFQNYSQIIRCENVSCIAKNDVIPNAYSWLHVKELGWTFKKADLWNGEKASPYNKELVDSSGESVEVYCPICSKANVTK